MSNSATAERVEVTGISKQARPLLAADASYRYLMEGQNSLIVSDRVQGVVPQAREGHIHGFSRGLLRNVHEWRLGDGR